MSRTQQCKQSHYCVLDKLLIIKSTVRLRQRPVITTQHVNAGRADGLQLNSWNGMNHLGGNTSPASGLAGHRCTPWYSRASIVQR